MSRGLARWQGIFQSTPRDATSSVRVGRDPVQRARVSWTALDLGAWRALRLTGVVERHGPRMTPEQRRFRHQAGVPRLANPPGAWRLVREPVICSRRESSMTWGFERASMNRPHEGGQVVAPDASGLAAWRPSSGAGGGGLALAPRVRKATGLAGRRPAISRISMGWGLTTVLESDVEEMLK